MCGRRETFNLHDFRYGLPLGAPGERVLRGQRIRCCPRRKSNPGCGAFVTILFADALPRLSFTASLLGKLLARLCLGDSINKAWKAAGRVLSVDGAYRLLRRARDGLGEIRTLLLKSSAPPPSRQYDPLLQTAEHLRCVFDTSICPIAAFQMAFQLPILG